MKVRPHRRRVPVARRQLAAGPANLAVTLVAMALVLLARLERNGERVYCCSSGSYRTTNTAGAVLAAQR
jgi:hypothetical protein